ncbi:MAG: hypothetical protein Q9226_004226 [Calogaya cf. arnoldii]
MATARWYSPEEREPGLQQASCQLSTLLSTPSSSSWPFTQQPGWEVDVINPAIETIISLFARPDGVLKIKLILNLGYTSVPGVMDWGEFALRPKYFTMDLPNLMEKWRTDYTFGAMEIFWRGEAIKTDFLDQQTLIAELGWEVFEEEDMERPWLGPYFSFGGPDTFPLIHFLLKRKKLTGPLLASDPCPSEFKRLQSIGPANQSASESSSVRSDLGKISR